MATIDMHSLSQVAAILAQIYHVSLPQDWWAYVTLLDEIIDDQEAQASYKVLKSQLKQFSVVRLFHRMLEEELTVEGPRTLPASLAAEYPWTTTPNEVVEAYLTFALHRDHMIGRP